MKLKIKIDVVSDVVCPWCYIGKKRLDKAVAALTDKFDFDIQYLPFELNPNIPEMGTDHKAYLVQKFGSEARYEELTKRVTDLAADEGITFDYAAQKVYPNTRRLHALIQFAGTKGLQIPMMEVLFNAYFTSGIDLTKEGNIVNAAIEAGLDEEEVRRLLKDENSIAQVAATEQEISKLGITGVPFYIINNKYGVSGAQATETFIKAFTEIGSEPVLEGEACDTDGKNC